MSPNPKLVSLLQSLAKQLEESKSLEVTSSEPRVYSLEECEAVLNRVSSAGLYQEVFDF